MRAIDVAYFTASCDDLETNKKFSGSLDLDYPVLSDFSRETARQYGVVREERETSLRWTFYIGKDGSILFIDKDVRPHSSGDDCIARLRELAAAAEA